MPVEIPVRDLAYFSAAGDRWQLEGGDYEVSVGASSRDLRWQGIVQIEGDDPVFPITLDSSVQEWLADRTVGARIRSLMTGTMFDPEGPMAVLLGQNPIRSFADFAPDVVDRHQLESLAFEARAAR